MSNSSKIIIGLDIGTTKICAIVGRKNEHGKVTILGVGKTSSLGGVQEGMVSNIGRTAEAIQTAVNMASAQSNVDIASVYVGIAGRHIRSFTQSNNIYRDNADNEITHEELEDLRKRMLKINTAPGSQVLHVLPQEYRVDGIGSDDPVGMTGLVLDVNYHIITGQITAANNIARCVERCGIKVKDIVVEPVASARAVLTDEEMQAGVAILDIGGGTSDLAIFHDGRIRHTTVIPIGGQLITRDISEAFKITEPQAEKLKQMYGNAVPYTTKENEAVVVAGINGRSSKEIRTRSLSLVINARLKELFSIVSSELKNSHYDHKLTAGLVVTGGGADLKNIAEYLEFSTGHVVKIGLANQHIAKGISDVRSPMFATGAGLVIYGIEKEDLSDQNYNTIKQPQQEAVKQKPLGGKILHMLGFKGSMLDLLKEDDAPDDFQKD
jgi:cell division protein FtsA